ncbi:hypothetical protein [Paenibacillus thalictri]|uniref:hypothetical protein n=1 Tax=Paenibacillus thalictri TaxID=2527873 RepID=UPI0013EEF9CB|nr:hypothetical protein [Paenibacillus thalictri]
MKTQEVGLIHHDLIDLVYLKSAKIIYTIYLCKNCTLNNMPLSFVNHCSVLQMLKSFSFVKRNEHTEEQEQHGLNACSHRFACGSCLLLRTRATRAASHTAAAA